ncbi:MAG: sensor histidine kinase [Beutenbergiaceae bacterium]
MLAALWIYWRRHLAADWVPIAMVAASLTAQVVGDGALPLLLVAYSLIIVVVVAMGVTGLFAMPLRLFAEAARPALAASIEVEKELVLARERAREAGELHDGLGHQLTAIGLLLTAAHRQRDSNPDRAWQTVVEARAASADALRDRRTWVRALHPTPLEDLEDGTAFAELAQRFQGTDLGVEVDARVAGLGPDIALIVRRCVQEGLTNVVRHAGARRARVRVHQYDNEVQLEIDDDGAGITESSVGFGLTELRRRVADLGGSLTMSDSTMGGLRLAVVVPT